MIHQCFAHHSSTYPSSTIFFNYKKRKRKNSSHTKEKNKSMKTTVPVVEGCEEHTCTELGVEDDHLSGTRSISFERRVKLVMDNFHTFWELAGRTKNSTRQLHESIVIEWMCKCECRTHRESALLKINSNA
jgi:hypothetical protein